MHFKHFFQHVSSLDEIKSYSSCQMTVSQSPSTNMFLKMSIHSLQNISFVDFTCGTNCASVLKFLSFSWSEIYGKGRGQEALK